MPRTHLLDTSVYGQLIRPKIPDSVTARWQTVGDAAMVICSICEAEVLYGIKRSRGLPGRKHLEAGQASLRLQNQHVRFPHLAMSRFRFLPGEGPPSHCES